MNLIKLDFMIITNRNVVYNRPPFCESTQLCEVLCSENLFHLDSYLGL